MSARVLVTMQVTTKNTTLEDGRIEERLAALVRECFDADAEHASVSVQAYDPDAPAADDVCASCGCVIGDSEQHAAWHRHGRNFPPKEPEPNLPTFGEDPYAA